MFNTVRYAGAIYLVYLGWKSFRDAKRTSLLNNYGDTKTVSIGGAFREGFFCNLLNPKFTVFLVSIFSQFVGPETMLVERIVYGAIVVVQGLIVWSLFVLVVQTQIVQRTLEKFQVSVNRLIGAVLISFGLAVAVRD